MPPYAADTIKDVIDGMTEDLAKKLHVNGSATGLNGHVKPVNARHPLDPLCPAEISFASAVLRASYPVGTPIHFKTVTLDEPSKALLTVFLDAEHSGASL